MVFKNFCAKTLQPGKLGSRQEPDQSLARVGQGLQENASPGPVFTHDLTKKRHQPVWRGIERLGQQAVHGDAPCHGFRGQVAGQKIGFERPQGACRRLVPRGVRMFAGCAGARSPGGAGELGPK